MDQEHIAEPSEVAAALAARRELGPDYDLALAESFLERVEQRIDERILRGERLHADRDDAEQAQGHRQFVLGIVSLGTGIPITAISAAIADLPGLIVAWCGIVGVNLAHAVRRR